MNDDRDGEGAKEHPCGCYGPSVTVLSVIIPGELWSEMRLGDGLHRMVTVRIDERGYRHESETAFDHEQLRAIGKA